VPCQAADIRTVPDPVARLLHCIVQASRCVPDGADYSPVIYLHFGTAFGTGIGGIPFPESPLSEVILRSGSGVPQKQGVIGVLTRMSHSTGRVAAKSRSIRRRREVKIRKSSYGPSSAVLLVVLAPRFRFLVRERHTTLPDLLCCATWSRYWLPSAAQSGNLQLPVHLAE
jgi:hypothetical protein